LKINIGTLVLIAVVALGYVLDQRGLVWTASRIIGLSIVVPSFVLLCLARIQLGKAFSLEAKASTLVTTGLYSRIRNPIYVFGTFTIAGIIIWMSRPWLFLMFAVIIPLQVYRTRKEGQVMEQAFGEAYREYKKKTWF
jgi:protein-S-isoprenylcysteine O-methyltransferase Ste14